MAESARVGALASLARPGHFGGPAGAARDEPLRLAVEPLALAWNLQGEASSQSFLDAAREATGLVLPARAHAIARQGALAALWLGPTSWLLVAGADAGTLPEVARARASIAGAGGALFDVTHGRTAISIGGRHAATVLAKGTGIDLHPRVFGAGECRSTAIARMQTVIVRDTDAPVYRLLVNRSYAASFWEWLTEMCREFVTEIAR